MKKITFLLAFFIASLGFAQAPVGNGVDELQSLPFDPFFGYTYSQSIYYASEINANGNITSLQWYFSGAAGSTMPDNQNITVYLGHTTKTSFASTTDWEPLAGLTAVYTGGIPVNGPGWVTITFTTPFAYNGTDNLVIAVDENMANYDASSDDFYNTAVSSPRSIFFRSDSVNPDPANPPVTGSTLATVSFVPNVILQGITPACIAPTNVAVSNISTQSVQLDWDNMSSVSQFDFEYVIQPVGTGAPTTTGTAVVGNTVTDNTLQPNTSYEVYVRANCGTSGYSTWSGPVSFLTLCPAFYTAPWTYNVETAAATTNATIEDCWTTDPAVTTSAFRWNVDALGSTPSAGTGPSGAKSGTKYFYTEGTSGTTGDDAELYSPLVDVTNLNMPSLQFYYHMYGANMGELHVDVYNGTTWVNDVDLIIGQQQTAESDPWLLRIVDLSTYTGTIQVRFRGVRANGGLCDMALDDIFISEAPTCFPVTNVLVNTVTDATVGLSWTYTGPATAWNIEYGPVGFVPGTGTVVSATTNPFVVGLVTPLSPNTVYEFYVQTDCGAGDLSFITGPVSAKTLCSAFTAPWTYDVETAVANTSATIEDCWSTNPAITTSLFRWNVDAAGSTPTSGTGPSGANSGTNYFYTEGSNGATGDVAELYSASVDVSNLNTPSLQFYYHMFGSNMGELHVDVYNGTSWTNDVDVIIGQQQTAEADPWALRIVDLSTYTGTIQVRFRALKGNGSNSDMAIDDISIKEAPTCFPVTNVLVDIVTDTTVGLAWTYSGPATSWNIEYGPVGFTPGTGTVVAAGSNPYVLGSVNPLTPDTSYEFYVQTDCGAGDLSLLTGPISFKTFCSPSNAPYVYDVETAIANTASSMSDCWSSNPSSTSSLLRWDIDGNGSTPSSSTGPAGANSGAKYFYLETTSGQIGDVAELYSPLVNITPLTVPTLQFYYHMYGSSIGELHVDIFNGTSWVNDFYIISGQQQTAQSDPWALQVLSLDAFTGVIQVRFRGIKAGTLGDISLDDISIIEAPSCLPTTNVVVSNVTNTQADVSWDDMSAVSQFDFQYVIQASGTGEPTAAGIDVFGANSVTDNTLTPNTDYEVWVRADCGADFSTWTGPVYFKTECDAFTVPYFENFDAYIAGGTTNPNVPDCWTNYDGGAGSCYISSSFAYSAPRSYYMNNSSDASGDYMLISPNTISLSSGLNRTRFFARSGTSGYEVQVGTMTDKTDPTTFTLISTVALTNVHTQYVVNIPAGTNQYLVFRHGLGGTFRTIYLDDIIVEAIPTTSPTCLTAITATPDAACGNFATSLAWDHVTGADGYKLNVGTTPGGTDVYNALDLGFVTNYSFSGSYNTTYYYTVVPFNANGDATGCAEMTFTTATNGCYCTSVPTSNDGLGVSNVLIGATNYPNGDVMYADYTTTGTPENLMINTTTNLQVTFATGFVYTANIWIDFNDDYNFDSSELVSSGTSLSTNPTTLDVSFTMPATTNFGNHRMRIGTAWTGQNTPNPCYSGSYGITLDFTVNVVDNLSTSTFVNDTFKVYPNPVRDILKLEYNSEITNVKVISLLGQVVINSDINATTTQIDMSQLNAGTYLVNVTIGDIVKTVKVVKQ
ncbi:fibronectin type III domain-containing protein [Flavobacterium chuncheonense]|uniref:Fibronectin type III domain-containing protein n=1 Tax=Flavobacterium chuncheonense TaxID=2026653 RepID=A0ABW5YKB9_9FLAO